MLRLATSGIHSFTKNDPIVSDIISQQNDLGVKKKDFSELQFKNLTSVFV